MQQQRVVIGSGPDALRAAAVLASTGQSVTLLQEGISPSGLQNPYYPVGNGWMRIHDDDREVVEAVLGPVVEAPNPYRAILSKGRIYRLPMSPHHVPRLFESHAVLPAARSWLRARFRAVTIGLLGGGWEERSYRDWVERRMGGPAYHHVYRDYAQRRWGADAEQLSVNVARVHHFLPDPGPFQVAGGGYDGGLDNAKQRILDAGGRIETNVKIEGLSCDAGKVNAVLVNGDSFPIDGPLWAAVDAHTLCDWLGESASSSMRVDAESLRALPLCVVALKGEVDGLPDDLHVLDEGALFWRVVVPYGVEKTALFHITASRDLPPDAELISAVVESARRLGIGDFSIENASVEHIPRWQPQWIQNSHARQRRILDCLREFGVVLVGRSGTMSPMDPASEISFASKLAATSDPDQSELHRLHLDPPVRLNDLGARITHWIHR